LRKPAFIDLELRVADETPRPGPVAALSVSLAAVRPSAAPGLASGYPAVTAPPGSIPVSKDRIHT